MRAPRGGVWALVHRACLSPNWARWPMHPSQTLVVSTHAHGVDEGKIRVHACAPRLPNLERGALRCPHLLPLVDLSWPLVDLTHVVPSLRLCMVSPTTYGWFFNSVSLVPFRVHLKGRLAFSGRGVATP